MRTGAGTALVGTPEQVAARLQEYADAGADTIVASGYPHLEEAYTVAELLFPHLTLRHATGETLAEPAASSSYVAKPQKAA